jgi:hypothetical protein
VDFCVPMFPLVEEAHQQGRSCGDVTGGLCAVMLISQGVCLIFKALLYNSCPNGIANQPRALA